MPHVDLAEHHIQDLVSLDVVAHRGRDSEGGGLNFLAPIKSNLPHQEPSEQFSAGW